MGSLKNVLLVLLLQVLVLTSFAQMPGGLDAIYSGVTWFDSDGHIVSAHGGCIIKDQNRYYLFGEKHSDSSNAFAGFNCYSSLDLYHWKFEKMALPVQDKGKLGPNRVGERVKVMKCPATGEYIMYMHVDTIGYSDQFVGYATSKTIVGPYAFCGPLLFEGKPIRKWDMGTFQDRDGSGYVLLHGGDIYKLNNDYKCAIEHVSNSFTSGFEAPAIFRKANKYYFLGSHLSSWEKNDNYYYSATSLQGPWTSGGVFCPEGTLTWNSQTTFVLPIEGSTDTTYMFMGDRWSFPHQASAATYIWQPIILSKDSLSIPNYRQAWKINLKTGKTSIAENLTKQIKNTDKKNVFYSGIWKRSTTQNSSISSDEKGAKFTINFTGRQLELSGLSSTNGGYALIELKNGKGRSILKTMVDTYCKYPVKSLLFVTPRMVKDNYILTVHVAGEHGNWTDKSKKVYGSSGNFIAIDNIWINE